ncbi:hypothetical protein AVEN_206110-1 [Araneus ventricosus]|uniref:Uncharacterized protein n=1 Tax=Araneus ventricosus TaxID=182803 RepID=A0A4Y2R3R6_ARAVE|nr:hypothetical protein AVEN_206110-1 [Araneus ventricosus]
MLALPSRNPVSLPDCLPSSVPTGRDRLSAVSDTKVSGTNAYQYQLLPDTAKPGITPTLPATTVFCDSDISVPHTCNIETATELLDMTRFDESPPRKSCGHDLKRRRGSFLHRRHSFSLRETKQSGIELHTKRKASEASVGTTITENNL